jgi:hypothetical protein
MVSTQEEEVLWELDLAEGHKCIQMYTSVTVSQT